MLEKENSKIFIIKMNLNNLKLEIRKIFLEALDVNYVTKEFIQKTAGEGGIDISSYDIDELIKGYKIELEHGKVNPKTNVTDDNPIATLKITIAHLNEIPDYNTRINKMEKDAQQGILNEKSKSKAQQRFMGMVYDCKKNPENCKKYSKNIQDVSNSMKYKDVKDFAQTKHKGIPEKIDEDCKHPHKKHKIVIEKSDVLNDEKKIELLKQFVCDCCKELGINEPAKLYFTTKRGGPIKTTASFNTENNDIYVYTQGRHFVDILRSSGHELKHWHQNLKGEITDDSGKDGSPHENEAHAFAGLMLRKFSKAFPEVYE